MNNERIQLYIKRFEEVYTGSPWYGDSIITKLNGVSMIEAFKQSYEDMHTIAEIVAHMVYWRQALVSRLEGDTLFKPSMESEDNWPSLQRLKTMGWPQVQANLAVSQQKIVAELSGKSDDFLQQAYLKKYTTDQLIQGVIDHDIYHLGQIGLVKKGVNRGGAKEAQ